MIQDTLDHMAEFCNAGIFIYDDASTDETVQICRDHPAVQGIIENPKWDASRGSRQNAEGTLRMQVLQLAAQKARPEWVYCFDADEFPILDLTGIEFKDYSGIRLRLWDFYITPEDKNEHWSKREWIGPEFRDILMFFNLEYFTAFPDREPSIDRSDLTLYEGQVKHYGKAISVENWEEKCKYYGHHLPEPYKTKWLGRMGKAIKWDMKSDFNAPLIKWDERNEKGFCLTSSHEALEARRR